LSQGYDTGGGGWIHKKSKEVLGVIESDVVDEREQDGVVD